MNIYFFNSLSSSLVDIKDQFLRNFTPQQRQITALAIVAIAGIAAAFFAIRYCLKRNTKKDEKDIEAQKDKAEIKDQDKKKIEKNNKIKEAAEKRLQIANKKDDFKTQEEKDAQLALKLSLEEEGGEESQKTDEELALELFLQEAESDPKEEAKNDEEVARQLDRDLKAKEDERATEELIKRWTDEDLNEIDKRGVDKENKDVKPAPAPAKGTPKVTPAPAPAKGTPKVTPAPAKVTPKATPKVTPVPAPAKAAPAPVPVDEKKEDVAAPKPEPKDEADPEKEAKVKKQAQDEAKKKAYEARQAEINKKNDESKIKATPILKAVNKEDEEIEKESGDEEKDLDAGVGDTGADIAGGEKPEPELDLVIEGALEAKDSITVYLENIFTERNPVSLKSNIQNYFDKGGTVEPFLDKISNQASYLNCLWEILDDYQNNGFAAPDRLSPEAIAVCLRKHAQLVGCTTLEELLGYAIKDKSKPLIEILVQQGLDLNAYVDSSDDTYLMTAVRSQDENLIKMLISKGAKVNQPARNGATPLELALHENYVEVAKTLIVSGATVNRQSPYEGNTALHLALVGKLPVSGIQALIATADTVLDTPNDKGETALLLAVRKNDPFIISELLRKGAKITDELLHVALNNPKLSVVDVLLKHGANPNYRDPNTGKIPLELVKHNMAIKVSLINNPHNSAQKADPYLAFSDGSDVVKEAQKNDNQTFLAFLKKEGFIKEEPAPKIEKGDIEEEEKSDSDVSGVKEEGNLDEVEEVELSEEEVEAKQREQTLEDIFKAIDSKSATPHIQAYIDAKGTVEGFIEALKNTDHEPASLLKLFEIFFQKYTEINLIGEIPAEDITKGLEACARSLKSNLIDLLEVAINQGNVWAVQQICTQNLDLNTQATKSGNTALITAVKSTAAHDQRWSIIDLLMKSGKAHINKTAKDGMTPLMTAVVKGNIADVRSLLLAGADANQAVEQGSDASTPLEYILDKKQSDKKQSDSDIVKALISSGAKSERHMPTKGSALHLAIVNGLSLDLIAKLAANGAKLDLTDKEGKTVINLICESKYVRFLLPLAKYIDLEAAIKSRYPLLVSEVLKVKRKAEPAHLWLALEHVADRTDVIIEKLVELGGLELDSLDPESNKTLKELAIKKVENVKNLKVKKFLENYKKPAVTK